MEPATPKRRLADTPLVELTQRQLYSTIRNSVLSAFFWWSLTAGLIWVAFFGLRFFADLERQRTVREQLEMRERINKPDYADRVR